MKSIIYGYYFAILIEKGENGYIAYAPGVGGVYEEGETTNEARENAYRAACAIFETRSENNNPISENNKYLRIMRTLPNSKNINKFGEVIPEGYIFTPACTASI